MSDFIEVSTSTLTGPALDWAVGYAVRENHQGVGAWNGSREAWAIDWSRPSCYSPSSDWSQGGPLIDEYMIDFTVDAADLVFAYLCPEGSPNELGEGRYAKTHLVAACRAIVCALIGDTIQVPAELVVTAEVTL